jgi:hypothetical protein
MDSKLIKVLAEACPVMDKLEATPQNSYPLGNGDQTGLLGGNEKEFLLNITKNDVWDRRLDSSNDATIYTDAEVRAAAMELNHGGDGAVVASEVFVNDGEEEVITFKGEVGKTYRLAI